jgi:hypothetical protein
MEKRMLSSKTKDGIYTVNNGINFQVKLLEQINKPN